MWKVGRADGEATHEPLLQTAPADRLVPVKQAELVWCSELKEASAVTTCLECVYWESGECTHERAEDFTSYTPQHDEPVDASDCPGFEDIDSLSAE